MSYCRHCRQHRFPHDVPVYILLTVPVVLLIWLAAYQAGLRDCAASAADAHRMHGMPAHDAYGMRMYRAYGLPPLPRRP